MILRRQRPVKGGRKPLPSSVLKSIHHKVDEIARKFRVSRSFVIATVLAEALGIKGQEKYYE